MNEMTDMAETINRVSRSGVPVTNLGATPAAPLPLIGLSGFASTGKTAAARFIEAEHGYRRQHIAEPMRRMLASLMRDYGYDDATIERYLVGDLKEDMIERIGATSRHCQITLGTEWGRDQIGTDLWANLWVYQAGLTGGVMNDSVRFPNEGTAIRASGGFTILIERPGTGPRAFKWKRLGPVLHRWFGCMWGVHGSERTDLLKPDYVVVNDATLGELERRVHWCIRHAKWRREGSREGHMPIALPGISTYP